MKVTTKLLLLPILILLTGSYNSTLHNIDFQLGDKPPVQVVYTPFISHLNDAQTTQIAINLIKHFEGFSSTPYNDNGTMRIGYGTKASKHIVNVSIEEADSILNIEFIQRYNKLVSIYTFLNHRELCALTSFYYNTNIGPNLHNSLVQYNRQAIIYWMSQYYNVNKKPVRGLIKRRKAEIKLFNNGFQNYSISYQP